MESANWRSYRRHHIVIRRTFLGLRRYDVWKRGQLVETFSDVIAAERHVDDSVESSPDHREQADPSPRKLIATLTAQERTMLEAIAAGGSWRNTARELGLSASESQAVKGELLQKIGASSVGHALRIGRFGGMLERPRGAA